MISYNYIKRGRKNIEKSYLHLEGRTPQDVQRELGAFYVSVELLATLSKDDPMYKRTYDDMMDRMRGLRIISRKIWMQSSMI